MQSLILMCLEYSSCIFPMLLTLFSSIKSGNSKTSIDFQLRDRNVDVKKKSRDFLLLPLHMLILSIILHVGSMNEAVIVCLQNAERKD